MSVSSRSWSTEENVIKSLQTFYHILLSASWSYLLFTSRSIVISTSVCLSVCLSVCEDIFRTTRAIFTNFYARCLWPWLGPSPAGWRNPNGNGQFWVFLPLTMHCTAYHLRAIQKQLNRSRCRLGRWVGLARGTVCYVRWRTRKGRDNFGRKHVPDKPNTSNNCELDWSVQWHTTGADAWLQAFEEFIIGREVWTGIAHRGWSLMSTIALFLFVCVRLLNFS